MKALEVDGPRVCKKAELHEMITLADSAFREGSEQSLLTDYPLVYRDTNLENIFIIKVNGEMASVVPYYPRTVDINGCRFKIGIISPTATSPNHQKKGYGLKCVNACVEKMSGSGIELSILWTRIPTFRFYEHAQYQGVRSQGYLYSCSKRDRQIFSNNGHQVIEYDPNSTQYLADIQRLHEREICGIVRLQEEYPFVCRMPDMSTFVALKDGEVKGYVQYSRAGHRPGLLEAGGDQAAVETLVEYVFAGMEDAEECAAYCNLTATVLGDLLEEKMPERKRPNLANMMIRINDVTTFMEKISLWLDQQNAGVVRTFSVSITDSNELISFNFTEQGLRLGKDRSKAHVELSLQEFTSIVFGAHPEYPVDVPDMMKGLFPFYFPIWELDHS